MRNQPKSNNVKNLFNMTISSSTLIAFSNDTEVVFFGTNAIRASEATGFQYETNKRGVAVLHFTKRATDTVFPKLVKAGYKLALLDA